MQSTNATMVSELRERLLGFNRKVSRLEHTRFFQAPGASLSLGEARGRVVSIRSVVDATSEPMVELELEAEVNDFGLHHFDRENIEAVVLTYRMLTQNNDRFAVARLADIYDHVHPVFRNTFIDLREQYAIFFAADSSLCPNGVALSHGAILDTVIYGELAHSNESKAAIFRQWTRWVAHEKALWLVFDHALRMSVEFLRYFRDINAAILMLYFDTPVCEEIVFKRLQEEGVVRMELSFPEKKDVSE